MLSLKNKIKMFSDVLNQEEKSYADSFNSEIWISSENCDFQFLEKLNSKDQIVNWIEKLKGRIVMREDEDSSEEIIDDYILCG